MFPLLLLTLEVKYTNCYSLINIFYHKLVKFEHIRMIWTTQNFGVFFDKMSIYQVNHCWHIVGAILKGVSVSETIG